MTIHLIRHGQSEFNALFDGTGDPMIFDAPLTHLGQEQAELARAPVADLNIAHIICSPLTRAIQTTQLIFPDRIPEIVAETRERLGHSCDVGRTPSELATHYPDLKFDHLQEQWWHEGPLNANGIPVEPREVFRSRVAKLRVQLQSYATRPLAVVCHGHVIRELTGIDPHNCQVVPLVD